MLLALVIQARPRAAELEVNPTDIPGLSVYSLASPQVDRRFGALFDRNGDAWRYFSPYVVVLSNQAQQSIDAVTLEWTVTDATGRTTTTYTTWEGYFNAVIQGLGPGGPRGGVRGRGQVQGAVVVNRQAQLLMTPMECEPTRICGNSAGIGGSIGSGFLAPDGSASFPGLELKIPSNAYVDELSKARKVSVVLDTVIFSDGLVRGPDRSKTPDRLQARDTAARALVTRALQASDEDIRAVLMRLPQPLPFTEPSLTDFFSGVQARDAANAADPRQMLTLYQSLVPLPKFHRE